MNRAIPQSDETSERPFQKMVVNMDQATNQAARKKILHCAYSGLGGHAAVLFELLRAKRSDEFEHFVLFYGIEDLCPEYAEACEQLGVAYKFIKKKKGLSPASNWQAIQTTRKFNPDVVMVNGTSLVLPLAIARSMTWQRWKILVRETQANHLKSKKEWIGSFASAQFADIVVYLTKAYQGEIDRRLKMPFRRWRASAHIVPNGIDAASSMPERVEPQIPTIVMASRLVPIKDHVTLLEAIQILTQNRELTARFVIAGDGPTSDDLKRIANERGIDGCVEFPGMLSKTEVNKLLRDSHVYVHCTFGETMSNSILQAMASGLPIVASEVKGVTNTLRHNEDAILVPVEHATRLADALQSLIHSMELREKLGTAAWQRAKSEFSRETMATRYFELFDNLAGSRAA